MLGGRGRIVKASRRQNVKSGGGSDRAESGVCRWRVMREFGDGVEDGLTQSRKARKGNATADKLVVSSQRSARRGGVVGDLRWVVQYGESALRGGYPLRRGGGVRSMSRLVKRSREPTSGRVHWWGSRSAVATRARPLLPL